MSKRTEPRGSSSAKARTARGDAAVEPSDQRRSSKSGEGRGRLLVIATPIGNLGDITLRALEALRAADVIACEDTRVTAKLLARYQIVRPLQAYHDHNARDLEPRLLKRMQAGETVALVTDAGTPMISDPGAGLVQAAIAADIPVSVLPGPSAALAALAVSGLPTDRFLFVGFPPPRSGERRRFLAELAAIPATLILYEAPHRLAESLADMAAVFGNRSIAVARELTKLHEEVRRGGLVELARQYASAPAPRGEIVVVIAPPSPVEEGAEIDLDSVLREAMGLMSLRDAVAQTAAITGLSRKEIYARALELQAENGE
jgi:16S rRNA (cytidine1402-2'-O)-methyltransferase